MQRNLMPRKVKQSLVLENALGLSKSSHIWSRFILNICFERFGILFLMSLDAPTPLFSEKAYVVE